MRIFKTKAFNQWAKKLLTDENLITAANELVAGKYDASLGKKVFKQRVAIGNSGKRGGTQTIVAFQEGSNVFFMFGFEKSERANITDKEKEALQKLATGFLETKDTDLNKAVNAKKLIEIKQKVKK